jgi:hypothetical protein
VPIAIINARIFDGTKCSTTQPSSKELSHHGRRQATGWSTGPQRNRRNLLPGLFDAHVHTSEQALKLALKFG